MWKARWSNEARYCNPKFVDTAVRLQNFAHKTHKDIRQITDFVHKIFHRIQEVGQTEKKILKKLLLIFSTDT
jgi:hypothetical protein